MIEFAHVHVHSEFSMLDTVSPLAGPKGLIASALALEQTHLAITDHGNIDGWIKFYDKAHEAGLTPMLGCELYVVDDPVVKSKGQKRYHAVVIIKSMGGFKCLTKLLTCAWGPGFYRKPRVSFEQILELEDIVLMTGCASGILSHPKYRDWVLEYHDRFGDDFYLEIQPLLRDDEPWPMMMSINEKAIKLSDEYGIKLVASNDVHYVVNDQRAHEVMLAMQTRTSWSNKKRWRFDIGGLYLCSAEMMIKRFELFGYSKGAVEQAMSSTMEIARKCEFEMPKYPVTLPVEKAIGDADSLDKLLELVVEGLERIGKADDVEYLERIDREVNTLTELGIEFVHYFLIVWELIRWCYENKIMVGPGRGSVGGSLVAYCLGITQVDPIEYGLIFERFLSPGRIDLPDIDMDFDSRKRHLVIEHMRDLYGVDFVAKVSTLSKLKGKAALRDVARVFDVPQLDVGLASKQILQRSGGDARTSFSIEDSMEAFEDCKRFKKRHPEVVKYACRFEGMYRHKGLHPAGVVLSPVPIATSGRCVLEDHGDDGFVVNWDKEDIEQMGFIKFDMLGLSTLAVLDRAAELVLKNTGEVIDYYSLVPDDPKVISEFNSGNTVGIFQFSEKGLQKFCQELGIDSFDLVIAASALWRPGTLRSGMAKDFVDRKNKLVEFDYGGNEIIERITKDTYGIILYQEQIMWMLFELAGIGWRTVDTVRKVISKSKGEELFLAHKKAFVDGCVEKATLSARQAADTFDQWQHFGSYGFNKSHATEYSLISYLTMYMKVYHPQEFICALLQTHDDSDKVEAYIREARRMNVPILLPDLNLSGVNWSLFEGKLVCGIQSIKGIGERAAGIIVGEREKNGVYKSAADLLTRVDRRAVNARVVKALNAVGALQSIGGLPEGALNKKISLGQSLLFSVATAVGEQDEGGNRIDLEKAAESLPFDPVDQSVRYRQFVDVISKRLSLVKISDAPVDELFLTFGKVVDVKYSYKSALKKAGASSKGLGSVYGYFDDGESYVMVVFDREVYQSRKDEIEHLTDRFVILEAIIPKDAMGTSITAKEFWRVDEMFSGRELDGLGLAAVHDLGSDGRKSYDDYLVSIAGCEACDLRDGCKATCPMALGDWNVMIIAEAPGAKEDDLGVPLIGPSGELLFSMLDDILDTKGSRDLFCISNVVKCRPPNNVVPNRKYAQGCATRWLDSELEFVKPRLVLALGNYARWYFTGQQKGILAASGSTEWIAGKGLWAAYSIHPAALLHNRSDEQEKLMVGSLESFAFVLGDLL